MTQLEDYETTLLKGWEDVHQKGQLSLWLLLALKDGAKHMSQIKDFVLKATKLIEPDDKSVYRALRRFRDSDMIDFKLVPSTSGPDLKLYSLTHTGTNVLQAFITRNINIFYQPNVHKLIEKGKE